MADSRKIYAHGTSTLRVAAFANGLEREEDLQDTCYAPGVHAPIVSLGKLGAKDGTSAHARAGWSCEIGMGTCSPMNNVYPVVLRVLPPKSGLAAWPHAGEGADPTHEELVECRQKVALVRQQKGGGTLNDLA